MKDFHSSLGALVLSITAIFLGSTALAQDKPKIPVKDCDEVIREYQKSCLKTCETYKETRKTQCEAACNDPGQLRLRKQQCEASRKS